MNNVLKLYSNLHTKSDIVIDMTLLNRFIKINIKSIQEDISKLYNIDTNICMGIRIVSFEYIENH